MTVYLLHSTVPIWNPKGFQVRHYIGHCGDAPGDLEARLKDHNRRRKNSANIVREFRRLGGKLLVGNVWPGAGHEKEHELKRTGHSERWCNICKAFDLQSQYGKAQGLLQ